eukprot:CAMPEP_0169175078 /NCGR_PEP_ID=MMETSP1015-20121227/64989_1 /TAXON_ID=342587 /ORGANISM="Karlodinium micrum, Strain CCMP2283" /LENGTH=228 /DNA_ID=CAMNT_0009249183 /DNA_START=137 /DNA_END=823 /DNA_ORIENTATION=-
MFHFICCGLCCERQQQKKNLRSRGKDRATSAGSARCVTKSFGDSMKETFIGQSFASRPDDDEDDSRDQRKHLKELKTIAKRLEGPVQKHPKSGKSLMKKLQDRYLACIPAQEAGDARHRDEIAEEIDKWKNGQLAYWEKLDAYKQGAQPKGHVMLLKIAKVWVSKDDTRGKSVVVKHKLNNEMQEMTLCFPTKRDAEEWSYALWEFISKLRGQSSPNLQGATGSQSSF